jgi:hypothetical protein
MTVLPYSIMILQRWIKFVQSIDSLFTNEETE